MLENNNCVLHDTCNCKYNMKQRKKGTQVGKVKTKQARRENRGAEHLREFSGLRDR